MSFRRERYAEMLSPVFGRALSNFLPIVTRRPNEDALLSCSASISHMAFGSVIPDRYVLTSWVQDNKIAVVARAWRFSKLSRLAMFAGEFPIGRSSSASSPVTILRASIAERIAEMRGFQLS